MKLKYYLKNNKKIYTLKDEVDSTITKDAHYKFIKIRDVRPSVSSETAHASQ
jgi:hypothetical protein